MADPVTRTVNVEVPVQTGGTITARVTYTETPVRGRRRHRSVTEIQLVTPAALDPTFTAGQWDALLDAIDEIAAGASRVTVETGAVAAAEFAGEPEDREVTAAEAAAATETRVEPDAEPEGAPA